MWPSTAAPVMRGVVTLRSAFFGTPEFAVPALSALHERTQVVGVVCQPDRRSGRGMRLAAPPVKEAALARGLDVYQPTRVRDGALASWLENLRVDFALVAAYGRILPPAVLAAPAHGCLNLHASILPSHRGAAPIQWAIVAGDRETGISLMQMDAGLDTGPVFAVRRLPISDDMNGGELTRALAELAAAMVGDELLAAVSGGLEAQPQDEQRATHAPPILKEHLAIDWSLSSARIVDRVRAFAPAPGAFTFAAGRRLKILEARRGPSDAVGTPGTILGTRDEAALVACGVGSVEVWRAGPEGKNPQSGRDLVNGRLLVPGRELGPGPG
jgi:methionyl-tRNA formyltransferase